MKKALKWKIYGVVEREKIMGRVLEALRDARLEDDELGIKTESHVKSDSATGWPGHILSLTETFEDFVWLWHPKNTAEVDRNTFTNGLKLGTHCR